MTLLPGPNCVTIGGHVCINIAVNGCSGFATSTQNEPFVAMLISRSRGTNLIEQGRASTGSEQEGKRGWHYLAPGMGLAAGVPFSSEFVRFAVAPSCQRLAELRTRARVGVGVRGERASSSVLQVQCSKVDRTKLCI